MGFQTGKILIYGHRFSDKMSLKKDKMSLEKDKMSVTKCHDTLIYIIIYIYNIIK